MRSPREDLERALAFMRSLDDLWCTRREPFDAGTAFFNEQFATQWDFNFLRVERRDGRLGAKRLAAEAERLQGGAGLEHRKVDVEDEGLGARLQRDFEGLGWVVDRLVVMAHGGGGERADTSMAAEMQWAEMEPMRRAYARTASWATSERIVEENVESGVMIREVTGARYFGVKQRGKVVSGCELYRDERTAQIEDVATLERYRGRGYAKAVVQLALDVALDEGCDLVFLVADDEDWPKELYAKLGFEPIGYFYEFIQSDTHPKAQS